MRRHPVSSILHSMANFPLNSRHDSEPAEQEREREKVDIWIPTNIPPSSNYTAVVMLFIVFTQLSCTDGDKNASFSFNAHVDFVSFNKRAGRK